MNKIMVLMFVISMVLMVGCEIGNEKKVMKIGNDFSCEYETYSELRLCTALYEDVHISYRR